jgi:predicted Rossmann fold nucleotide-binding protein DprA/Smf involved in DNA uptake
MRIDISIEFDQEFTNKFMAIIQEVSKQFKDQQEIFEKTHSSVSATNAQKITPEKSKPPKKKSRPQKTVKGTILKVVKKHKDGITGKELQEQTGFNGKQISNNMFHLKKEKRIEKTKDGLFMAL